MTTIFENYLSSAINGDSDELHEFQKIRLRHRPTEKLMSVDKFRDHSLTPRPIFEFLKTRPNSKVEMKLMFCLFLAVPSYFPPHFGCSCASIILQR